MRAPGRRSAANSAADSQNASARHEAKGIERQVQKYLLQAIFVGRDPHAIQVVSEFQPHLGLLRPAGRRNSAKRSQQMPKIGGRQLGRRLAVELQHVVDRSRQRAQPGLQLLRPLPRRPPPGWDFASSPANSSRLARGLRTSWASKADISAKAWRRRSVSCASSRRLPWLMSRRMKIELAPAAASSCAWRMEIHSSSPLRQ